MRRSLLAARVFNTPLMIDAAKLRAAEPFLTRELLGGQGDLVIAPDLALAAPPPARHMGKLRKEPYIRWTEHGPQEIAQLVPRTDNGVGIIEVEGTLVNKGHWLGQSMSGHTSYQSIMDQIAEARADDAIKAVVFEVDSYGGEVAGAFDCATAIRDLSREKPTLAILTDDGYSAGYLLAAQARQIVLPETGGCGSIGIVTMHVDYAAALDKAGIKITLVASGAHKVDGHPYAALPKAVAARMLAVVDATREVFAAAVAAGRGERLDKAAALATEAQCFYGPEAVAAGLADAVARPSEAFAEFVAAFPAG